ncbi:hypothetical protein ABZ370_26950 [Streptomyces sp. NPDC005962]|uniref:hypothetical protein n=1 Tax=Streptomyces sp. NPDC005962 TaxID=3154466 RepID=UPI00340FB336
MSNAGVAMAGRQLPVAIEEFASYLRALTRRIDPEAGWYAVFAQRDPDGLRACLDGQEVPPWDVVQALLQDLSAQRGAQTANVAAARAATLYRASITVHDAAPGTREALRARLAAMHRERLAAADREREVHAAQRAGAETTPDGDPLDAALAWAQDDHYRATARCEELTARLEALPSAEGQEPAGAPANTPPGPGPGPMRWPVMSTGPVAVPPGAPRRPVAGAGPGGTPPGPWSGPGPGPATGPGQRPVADAASAAGRVGAPPGAGPGPWSGPESGSVPDPARWPGADSVVGVGGASSEAVAGAGQRSATEGEASVGAGASSGAGSGSGRASWMAGGLQDPSIAGLAGRSQPDGPPGDGAPGGQPRPRGARFAGAGQQPSASRGARFPGVRGGARKREREAEERARVSEQQELAEARRVAAGAVARLGRLRAEGRSGEAHAVLCETAVWPAGRLPVLAGELERAGLGADVGTLLWEMACLPPERLAAAAEALIAGGRESDGERLLRQSVARPVAEVAQTALALLGNGAHQEVALMLTAFLRARTPAEVAEAAAEDPGALVPPLMDAAGAVSPGSQHDLAHALRVAGIHGAT